jgi:predicted MFS family arabinose efflux permease
MFINGWNFVTQVDHPSRTPLGNAIDFLQVYYIPTFYQLVYGYSAVKAGALLLPITLTQTLFSTFSGLIVHWSGRYRESILLGWIAWSIGLGLFSTLTESSGLGKQIGYAVITGFGVGQTLQPSLIAIQAGVSRRDMAVVTSFRNFIRNLGATLGLAVAGTIINNTLRSSLTAVAELDQEEIKYLLDNPGLVMTGSSDAELEGIQDLEQLRGLFIDGYRRGFKIIFYVGAGLSALAFVTAWFLLPQIELTRDDEEKLKAEGKEFDAARRGKHDGGS